MLTFLVQDKEDKIKEYLQSDPENLSLVGKISFQIQLPRPLVAVFTDGSEKRQDLERVKLQKPPGRLVQSSGISCTRTNARLAFTELATVCIVGDFLLVRR